MAKESDIAKYRDTYQSGYEAIRQARFEKQKALGLFPPDLELSAPTYPDWDTVENPDGEAAEMAVYAAMVDCMDQNIGRIAQALKDQGVEENTLLFFSSDNGGPDHGASNGVSCSPGQATWTQ